MTTADHYCRPRGLEWIPPLRPEVTNESTQHPRVIRLLAPVLSCCASVREIRFPSGT